MGFREEMNKEMLRLHLDARHKIIVNKIAGEIDNIKGEHEEIKERMLKVEKVRVKK